MADPLDDALDFVAGAMRAVSAANAGTRHSNSDATSDYSYASPNSASIHPDSAAAIPDDDSDSAVDSINAGLHKMADHGGGLGRGKQDVGAIRGLRDHGRRGLHAPGPATVRDEAGTEMTCPYFDCYIAGPHSHGVGTALIDYSVDERVKTLESQIDGIEALARINEDGYEADIARLTRELDEANASIDAQREEIARMVKECDGLRARLRAAKNRTAGGTRRPAEIPADYPDGSFSPSGIFSGGEEAGP